MKDQHYLDENNKILIPENIIKDMGLKVGDAVFFAKEKQDGYWCLIGPNEWDILMKDLEK